MSEQSQVTHAKCPKTGEPVVETETYYRFPGYPRTYCMKEKGGRSMSVEDYISILKGEDKVFDGFLSKKQKTFSAMIRHDEESAQFSFAFPPTKPMDITCPKSGEPVDDKEKLYVFPGYPNVPFWKEHSGREMSASDYCTILRAAPEPVEFHDFISHRTGKPFSGPLRFDPEAGKVVWAFDDSSPKKRAPKKNTAKTATATSQDASDDNPLADF